MEKVALVTGASSGFGLAITLTFARVGWRVFAVVRSLKNAAVLTEAAKSEKLPVTVIELDIARDGSVSSGMRQILEQTKRIDLLVNNAGFGFIGPMEDFTIEEMKEQFETNFFGQMRMIQSVIPLMRKQKEGMIVNMSSINGLVSFPLYGIYSASKFALETVSEATAFELAPFGIRVVLVEPGTFLTNFTNNRRHPARMNTDESPYQPMTKRFFLRLEKIKDSQILKRQDPMIVAKRIYELAHIKHPKLRYKIGLDAHVFHLMDRITPKFIKFALMRRAYRWPES